MHEHLFEHVNVPPENISHPRRPDAAGQARRALPLVRSQDSRRPAASTCSCSASAATATSASTSRSAPRDSRTRVCTLDPLTRRDAASDFFSEENVPTQAITMGLGTILDARKIRADRPRRAQSRRHSRSGRRPRHAARAGQLPPRARRRHAAARRGRRQQAHRHDHALAARARSNGPTRSSSGPCSGCANRSGKALLKLDDDDFRKHNLHQLLRHHGPAQSVAHRVFRWMMDTIEYHPAGREHEAGDLLQPAPRRRRDQHGRHADPPGRRRARGARRLHDQRQHRRVRPRRPAHRRPGDRVQPAVRHRRRSNRKQLEAARGPGPGRQGGRRPRHPRRAARSRR